ncbi:MAG TPA: LPXTG cell wall anchor domain-containing protein [Chitinophagaceae bacterium]|nr:LPXTG cell wall anchor domain-containing protein [Chitinophagaceae bacterium]
MKKYLLQAILLLTSTAVFAQNNQEHSAAYNWGEKNALYIILGVILVIVVIVIVARRKKKSP